MLNGRYVSDSQEIKHIVLDLPDDCSIAPLSIDEAMRIESGFLYIGAPWCPYCRNLMPVLIDVSSEADQNFYSLNLDEEKSIWAIENGIPICKKEGTAGYYRLLAWLDSYLREYSLESGIDSAATGEKRIYMPAVFYIEAGTPVGVWELSSEEWIVLPPDPYRIWSPMTEESVRQSLTEFIHKNNKQIV